MPFVPVVGFWSTQNAISSAELRDLFTDADPVTGLGRVVVLAGDAGAIGDALGAGEGGLHFLQKVASVEELVESLDENTVGIVRATQIDQRMHALSVNGQPLFGNDRVTDLASWPLVATVSSDETWDQSQLWTLVAGGDVMMDRGVAKLVRLDGLGGDYLFDGGTAEITRIKCCSYYGFEYPVTQRTGNKGAVRELFQNADMAMANLESAVLVNAPYHRAGFTFTADSTLLDAVDRAGFDYMSVANNHVRNAGSKGILTAARELDARGIAHAGSGRGDDAAKPGYVDIPTGIRVAVLSCDAIIPSWTATPDKVGTLNCKKSDVAGRIREIRDTADVVIVYPHWGREYKPTPVPYQRKLAQDWVDAGADLVVGAHSHIAGGMGDIDGHTVFYSIGNLIFDQDWSQPTMMGVIPEMTFDGTRLVQIDLHPTLIVDAQPNLVAPNDGGQFVIDQMRDGSEGLLPY